MGAEHVLGEQWFHATPQGASYADPKEWLKPTSVNGDRFAHLGTKKSAVDRASGWDTHIQPERKSHKLWTAQLKPGSKVFDSVLTDENAQISSQRDLTNQAKDWDSMTGHEDVLPYENDYEDRGSVSIAARVKSLDRVRPVGNIPPKPLKAAPFLPRNEGAQGYLFRGGK